MMESRVGVGLNGGGRLMADGEDHRSSEGTISPDLAQSSETSLTPDAQTSQSNVSTTNSDTAQSNASSLTPDAKILQSNVTTTCTDTSQSSETSLTPDTQTSQLNETPSTTSLPNTAHPKLTTTPHTTKKPQRNKKSSHSTTPNKAHELGRKAEDIAANYLLSLGWTILVRNAKNSHGELDIIALDPNSGPDELVIVEVRARSDTKTQGPLESIGSRKLRALIRSSQEYMETLGWIGFWRIDVIGITTGNKEAPDNWELEHVTDITS